MHDENLRLAGRDGVLECVADHAFASRTSDEFDGLHNAVDDDVLNARVFTLCVFTDEDGIYVVVGSLVADNGAAGTQVGKEVECAAQGEVERDVALANRSRERALEGDEVTLDGGNGFVGDCSLAILEDRSDINGLPSDGDLNEVSTV